LEGRMGTVEEACDDNKHFREESRKDRAELHNEFGDIKGELKAILAELKGVGGKVDMVFKKIYNGGDS